MNLYYKQYKQKIESEMHFHDGG